MRRALFAAAVALMVAVGIAQAQSPTPEAITYEGHELVFDAADGPVQFLVVATTVRTVTTLDGQTTSETASLVEFASTGDGYEQRGDPLPPYPRTGALATANVGDTFGLAEIGGE